MRPRARVESSRTRIPQHRFLSQASERAHQLQGRLQAQTALADQSGGLPGRALAVADPGKADADLVSAEDRIVALGRRVLLVEDLALPAAALGGVSAEIVEKRVAAENMTVVEQNHPGQAAFHAVKHADLDRVESVSDTALA